MKFLTDFHVHSRYSRATSKNLTIFELASGAQQKGLHIVGTGDFTHPAWLEELEENLVTAEPGLYRLKNGKFPTRFILTSEISTIYKQDDKVRKVHHLLVAPDFESVHAIAKALAAIGNIISDGRPILGINSRDLLEIVLGSHDEAFLIPAHIWTPWFSALGSKSGFDSIEGCYLDLASYIFAVETGLSSDPPMNWRVSSLDGYHLVSNSDAHSKDKLGREATIFDTGFDYYAMKAALTSGEGLAGTLEFFPEEGKYHLDGHRNCGVVLSPEETLALDGLCPVCGRPVTVGVLNRVMALADRAAGEKPATARPFFSLIPLKEILGEIMQVGSSSKRVRSAYDPLVKQFGGELPLLLDINEEDIKSAGSELLALAISRMRQGLVHKDPGYDGRFGKVRVLLDNEHDTLFQVSPPRKHSYQSTSPPKRSGKNKTASHSQFNDSQQKAINFGEGYLMVMAGPGTGKTRVLVERMRSLQNNGQTTQLAITFTNKAAQEIRDRLLGDTVDVFTFHALAARIMQSAGLSFEIADDVVVFETFKAAGIPDAKNSVDEMMYCQSTEQELAYEHKEILEKLKTRGIYTYEGLIAEAISIIQQKCPDYVWDHILVDEFQDINPIQYRFLKILAQNARSLMVIGDPNQAIYGFRGSNPRAFDDFIKDFNDVACLSLKDSYRLSDIIAHASNAFIGDEKVISSRKGMPLRMVKTQKPSDFIAREIESLAGGLSHCTLDNAQSEYGLSDIAVIVRTRAQARPIIDALAHASIPFDTAYARPLADIDGISQRIILLERRDFLPYIRGVGDKSLDQIRQAGSLSANISSKISKAQDFLATLNGTIVQQIARIEESSLFSLPQLAPDHWFYHYARIFGSDLQEFITFCRLNQDQHILQKNKENVNVITAHAAKGLEYKCVFITGLQQGVFPLKGSPDWEEQNLFYVAMTRAEDLLYMVYTPTPQSRFISMIPESLYSLREERFKRKSEQMLLFEF